MKKIEIRQRAEALRKVIINKFEVTTFGHRMKDSKPDDAQKAQSEFKISKLGNYGSSNFCFFRPDL